MAVRTFSIKTGHGVETKGENYLEWWTLDLEWIHIVEKLRIVAGIYLILLVELDRQWKYNQSQLLCWYPSDGNASYATMLPA